MIEQKKGEDSGSFIDELAIEVLLNNKTEPDPNDVNSVIEKARQLKGLDIEDVALLMKVNEPELLAQLFDAAKYAKEEIYGNRIVLFAPLYISNICHNECSYCAFRVENKQIARRSLKQKELNCDVQQLLDQGHKRVLLVAGESAEKDDFQYVLESLKTIYAAKSGESTVRRVNVNLAPLKVSQYEKLKEIGIGTYQIFQETYHKKTYQEVHISGKKRNYNWRLTAPDRAMQAGIDDIGIGALLGLYDWKFEMLAMFQHIKHLEDTFGVGPHTISVPRLEPADGSLLAANPPHAVSDADFKKIVAILRLTVPYTGIIMSTRESKQMRRETLELGVSQLSGGSKTNPGGYAQNDKQEAGQFEQGDHRTLDEIILELAENGYIPSFCTGCYRLGRTGQDFMEMAKPGLIKKFCQPNAVFTFQEYLNDYASPETKKQGEALIEKTKGQMDSNVKKRCEKMLIRISSGERDVYV